MIQKVVPHTSVVLATYNRLPFLKACIKSIRKEVNSLQYLTEIIVVDGGSHDGTLRWLSKQRDILTIIQHNRDPKNNGARRRSWGYFINLGFRAASGKYVCMLSDDVIVVPGALKNGLAVFHRNGQSEDAVGAVAFYYREWPHDHAYFVYKMFGEVLHVNHGIFSKAALEKVGYADEGLYSFYRADNDLCIRISEAGFTILECKHSKVEHYSSATSHIKKTNQKSLQQDSDALFKKWQHYYRPHDTERRFYDRLELEVCDESDAYRCFPGRMSRVWRKVRGFRW